MQQSASFSMNCYLPAAFWSFEVCLHEVLIQGVSELQWHSAHFRNVISQVSLFCASVRDHFIHNKDHDWETGSIIVLHTSFQKIQFVLLNITPECWSEILPLNLQLKIKLTIKKKKKRQADSYGSKAFNSWSNINLTWKYSC